MFCHQEGIGGGPLATICAGCRGDRERARVARAKAPSAMKAKIESTTQVDGFHRHTQRLYKPTGEEERWQERGRIQSFWKEKLREGF